MEQRTILTAEGLAKLKAELAHLKDERRQEIIERIRVAKEHGDLKENADYHMAREEQAFVEGRIQELETLLKNADVASATLSDQVAVGSTIHVHAEGGSAITYQIVGATEADPSNKKISFESPLGTAFMNKKSGDVVRFVTPNGTAITYTIERVE